MTTPEQPQVRINGAFRSGTNYVKALLELNYDVYVVAMRGGWKHAPVPAIFAPNLEIPVVGSVKDPWSWLVSMWNFIEGPGGRHVRAGGTWSTFLTSPLTISQADHESVPDFRFASPVDYWNAIAANLLSLGDRVRIVRYEDLLADPEGVCKDIAARFDLAAKGDGFVQVEERTRNMVDRPRTGKDDYVTGAKFDPSPFLERTYLQRYDRKDRKAVLAQLDPELMRRLDYEVDPFPAAGGLSDRGRDLLAMVRRSR